MPKRLARKPILRLVCSTAWAVASDPHATAAGYAFGELRTGARITLQCAPRAPLIAQLENRELASALSRRSARIVVCVTATAHTGSGSKPGRALKLAPLRSYICITTPLQPYCRA